MTTQPVSTNQPVAIPAMYKIENCGHDGKEQFRIYDQKGNAICYAQNHDQAENVVRLLASQPSAQPSAEAVRWDLFPGWLIDHCEGDTITEEGLQKALSDMLAHDKANNCPKCGQDWSEHEMGVPAPYCPAPQPSTTDSDVRDAAQAVVREALDRVTVHPCDEHNDEVRSNALVGPMADLYRALKSSPPATEAVRKGFWDVYEPGNNKRVYVTVFNSLEADSYRENGYRVVEQSAATEAGEQRKPKTVAYPTFTKGQIFESLTHGTVTFVGMDTYMGETTYQFRSSYGDHYWLPRTLRTHLGEAGERE